MKSLARIFGLTALMFGYYAIVVVAQAPKQEPTPKTAEVTIKSTPASDALIEFAKNQSADQKAYNEKFQQARSVLDANSKALNEQIVSLQKDLQAKLSQDKKYKPMLSQIADLQKKLNEVGQTAQAAFQKDVAPLQNKANMEGAEIQGLLPVVRKENGLPDNATFDIETQKWTVPEKK